MEKSEGGVAVVGSGPNGLAAAIEMAKAGFKPIVFEYSAIPGGGLKTAELTLSGYRHDVCSSIHPLGAASPFFRSLELNKYGLEWIHPPIPLAHPFDDGTAAVLCRSISETADNLNLLDRSTYKNLMSPLVISWEQLLADILAPIHIPKKKKAFAEFAVRAMLPASFLIKLLFKGYRARGLFAGLAAHSFLPLGKLPSAAFGLMLGITGHAVGWPMVKGGSQKFTDALVGCLKNYNGTISCNHLINSINELAHSEAVLLDITPKQLLKIAPNQGVFTKLLYNRFRYGPGVFKIDWALNGPIPWKAAICQSAGTVHVGGTFEEIEESERLVASGYHPQRPFVLVSQQSLFDITRAPEGKHTGWAYCHVPNGSAFDMTERIESQMERFAPGFRECIIARNTRTAVEQEKYNPNCIGGDINGGALDLFQLFIRPIPSLDFYATGQKGVFLCSSSTPPGPGVHGMCGYYAAQSAIRYLQKR